MSRFAADAIDGFVTLLAVAGLYVGVVLALFLWRPRRFSWPAPGAVRLGALWWLFLVLYLTIAWSTTGRSAGKRILGLRVVNRRGARVSLATAFVRAVLCAAFPIGLLWAILSRESRSVQDLVLRTSVVYDWQLAIVGASMRSHATVP